ncbi:hypothetical protein NXS19_008309 [Fusarium pseudograminearum]|nr:hypothetical protein NXS19_008309 [Fusarium pseudograminearum]
MIPRHSVVTTDCEVLRTTIDGTEYFFIDTSGFHDNVSSVATFERIYILLNTINKHAVLVGLWYVVGITRSHRPLDTSVVEWIQRCLVIPPFPSLKVIATHWDSDTPLKEIEHRFRQRMGILKDLIDDGALYSSIRHYTRTALRYLKYSRYSTGTDKGEDI